MARASVLRASVLRASVLRASVLRASVLRASVLRAFALWMLVLSSACAAQTRMDGGDDGSVADRSLLRPRMGVRAGLMLNMHRASFSALPGIPNCCGGFESGSGTGMWVSADYQLPVDAAWTLLFALEYADLSASLTHEQGIGPVLTPRGPEDAFVRHVIDGTIHTLSLQPMLQWRPLASVPLRIIVGPSLGMYLSNSFAQREELITPGDARFDDGSSIRNQHAGDVPQATGFSAALVTGLRLPLTLSPAITIEPEASLRFAATSTGEAAWYPHGLRAGIGVVYTIPEPPPPPPPPPVAPPPALAAELGLHARNNAGVRLPDLRITVDRTTRGELFPLLPYVFFEQQQSDIPAEAQVRLTREQTTTFRESTLPNQTLLIYRNLLNIVGARLRANPSARLTLTGCNNANEQERNNTALSRARAESVRRYLVEVWDIDPGRLTVQARNLPAEAPDPTTVEGREEARRVELTSSSWEILMPLQWRAEEQSVSAPAVVLTPHVASEAGLARWSASIEQRGMRLASWNGAGTVPAELVWHIDSANAPATNVPILAHLEVMDRADQSRSADTSVMVLSETRTTEIVEKVGGRRIDRFSLILFDFKKSTIGSENARILDIVRRAITPSSRVTIYGYADRTGNPELNRALARDRCESVRRVLGQTLSGLDVRVEAVGSDTLLFDNALPEGRNYCRTVQIVVETGVPQ